MGDLGIGGFRTIGAFVKHKLRVFGESEISFRSLFELMFSEKSNVMYERSVGYRIEKVTYGESYERILRAARHLKNTLCDLPEGTVVGLYMDNSLEWIELFWAILGASFRPLLMNTRLDDRTLEKALADSGAGAVIASGKTFSVRTLDGGTWMAALPEDEAALPEIFGSALYVMSSGTSEHVKLCEYTAIQFFHQIEGSVRIISENKLMKKHYDHSLKQLTFLPFYHVFGLIAVYIWFSFFSRTFVQLNDLAPQTITNTIKRHHVTHIFAVPLFWEKVYGQALSAIRARGDQTYERFMKAMRVRRRLGDFRLLGDLFSKIAFREVRENLFGDSISLMISGGSMISGEVLSFFNDIGYPLVNGYGMSEISITSVELTNKRSVRVAGYVGKPVYGLEYRIVDGKLQVRGGSLAESIIVDGKRQKPEGWFETNDLAEEKKGHYRILGRSDDLIISSSGENVNPNLAEKRLNVPGVNGVCIVGGREGGETVPVLLASVPHGLSNEQLGTVDGALKEQIRNEDLSVYVRKIVYITDPLMKDSEFKVNRKRLSEAYNAGRLHFAEPGARDGMSDCDDLMKQIAEFFAEALGAKASQIRPDSDFFLDEGGTSLDYFAMVTGMQDRYGVAFPVSSDKSLSTVREFYEYIKEHHVDQNI